ncbi:MAG: hypothetical protein U0835_25315 [Isosphaeraceae bacterium]
MPKALFTPKKRAELSFADALPEAVAVSIAEHEDVYEIEECRVTCRYWSRGGDFVSRQVLGCGTAVRTGHLLCDDVEAVEEQVYETESILGMVGPEDAVDRLAERLARHFTGVLVDGRNAVRFGGLPGDPSS